MHYPRGSAFNIDGPMVKRLRHHPFTVVTWVQVPLGSPQSDIRKRSVDKRSFFACFFAVSGIFRSKNPFSSTWPIGGTGVESRLFSPLLSFLFFPWRNLSLRRLKITLSGTEAKAKRQKFPCPWRDAQIPASTRATPNSPGDFSFPPIFSRRQSEIPLPWIVRGSDFFCLCLFVHAQAHIARFPSRRRNA